MLKIIIAFSLALFSVNAYSAEKVITVAGTTQSWMSTGICFNSGDSVTIAVSGSVKHSDWDGSFYGPDGNPGSLCGSRCKPFSNSCNVAALVARVGNGQTRCVGSAISGVVRDSGELNFGINDMPTLDNEGSFRVAISGGSLCGGSSSGGNAW